MEMRAPCRLRLLCSALARVPSASIRAISVASCLRMAPAAAYPVWQGARARSRRCTRPVAGSIRLLFKMSGLLWSLPIPGAPLRGHRAGLAVSRQAAHSLGVSAGCGGRTPSVTSSVDRRCGFFDVPAAIRNARHEGAVQRRGGRAPSGSSGAYCAGSGVPGYGACCQALLDSVL